MKSERQRQKSLAKRNKRANEVKKLARINRNISVRDTIFQTVGNPWGICFARETEGMASVLASRRTRNGGLLMVVFLVDSYCLGVKDAFYRKDVDFEDLQQMFRDGGNVTRLVTPEYIVKFVRAAIDYARSIGFEPAPNTETFLHMFDDIDAEKCQDEFVFGSDGKPLYTSGPNDDIHKSRTIIHQLQKLGPGNFHFIIGGSPGETSRLLLLEANEDLESSSEFFEIDEDEIDEDEIDEDEIDEDEIDEVNSVDALTIKRLD